MSTQTTEGRKGMGVDAKNMRIPPLLYSHVGHCNHLCRKAGSHLYLLVDVFIFWERSAGDLDILRIHVVESELVYMK